MLLKVIQYWIRRFNCSHDNRILEGIVREPVTYARQGNYYCPDCERNWVSWKLPDGLAR